MRIVLAIIAVLVLILGGVWAFRTWAVPSSPIVKPTLAKAKLAMNAQRYDVALQMCEELIGQRSDSAAVLLLAGEAASKLEQFDAALDYYQRVPDSAGSDAATARWACGEIQFFLGNASQAIESLNASLDLNPRFYLAHQRLVNLLNTFGRRRETLPHLVALLQAGRASLEDLLLLGNLAKAYDAPLEVQRYLTAHPDDLLPTLGTAVTRFHSGDLADAEQLLRRLIAQQPELLEAHVQLGFVLEKQQPESLRDWNQQLPPDADSHPDVWYLRGQMLRAQVRPSIRCLAEAIARDPNHLLSHNAIAQLLKLDGQVDRAREFADKASKLQRINIALEQIYKSNTHFEPMREISQLTLELGRVWECLNWCGYVASVDPQLAWPREISNQARTATQFDARSPYVMPWANLVTDKDWLADYPLPDLSKQPASTAVANERENPPPIAADGIHFEDVAASSGLNFTFDNNSAGEAPEGRHIFETTGGGVGIIDIDLDGFPDVAFAQGGRFPNATNEEQPSDQLFRNLPAVGEGRMFQDITPAARIAESAFGQGIAVGDVNVDGFDDLYVCNIGENRLWMNNGDGTFSDATVLLPAAGSAAWTCSAAIADLNFDGLPEIYDANYVTGDDVYTRICDVAGKPRGCSPLVFQPTMDRVLTPGEDGRFREITTSPNAVPANSLGVVVFKMADELLPHVFVSADQQANLLLRIEQPQGDFTLQDEALLSGIAYDAGGRAQACMGIAAGDVNQDGQIDLYVTNFYLEYNTLYVQSGGGLFEDGTSRSGTVRETTPMLGFGTQFLDAQLDGLQDLLVLNGHIDDHTHIDIAQQMPAQVFAGLPRARFEQIEAARAGRFFAEPRLGRALAKFDFDRDGLVDAVCSDLESPAALLHNRSLRSGNYVNVRVVGRASDRNAFCAIATLSGDDYRQTLQLTGGSGYQASNERVLNFSVPSSIGELTLSIQWPSGASDVWTDIRIQGNYTAVESQGVYLTD